MNNYQKVKEKIIVFTNTLKLHSPVKNYKFIWVGSKGGTKKNSEPEIEGWISGLGWATPILKLN